MRLFLFAALLLPMPALADQIPVASRITAVTVYPEGAEVTREVTFSADAGAHDVLVMDLPVDTPPELIRLTGSTGMTLGSFALRTDRLPPRDELTSPALQAARDAVAAQEAALHKAQGAVDAIMAKVQAAEAQAAFVAGIKVEGGTLSPEGLKALAGSVGTEVLAARQAALAARAELPPLEKALREAEEALAKARAAEEAVLTGAENHAALSVAARVGTAGEYRLTITHLVPAASWTPVYDLMLTRAEPSLTVRRGVLVTQYSGEDWQDVDLTLSTAQPMRNVGPSQLYPELRTIADPASAEADYARGMAEPVMEPMMVEAATASAPVDTALAGFQGDTVVYHYPTAVSIATGVDNVRLALDEKTFQPKVYAQAVPRLDDTAYLMAKVTNDSAEILLPGQGLHYREGVLVGGAYFQMLPPGAEVELAFGAIDGLRLKREMPLRAEGDRGLLGGSTELSEQAVLEVENLTTETWPVRLIDRIPYTEQEDLEISHDADLPPSEVDVDGQRGILAWEFDLPGGETKAITLTHSLRWPEGKELQ